MPVNNLKDTMEAQRLIQEVQNSTPKVNEVNPTQPQCSQCGTFHPPIAANEKCPLSEPKTKNGEKIDTSKFVVQIRDMVVSQLEQKGIKDQQKFFSHLTVELMKIMEAYSE